MDRGGGDAQEWALTDKWEAIAEIAMASHLSLRASGPVLNGSAPRSCSRESVYALHEVADESLMLRSRSVAELALRARDGAPQAIVLVRSPHDHRWRYHHDGGDQRVRYCDCGDDAELLERR